VSVPEKYVVIFKPGKVMEDRMKELERQGRPSRSRQKAEATAAASSNGDTKNSSE
jgi:hypothetical protein